MQRLSVEEFKEADKLPLIVVLDDVRSMHNVGSVFRTGDAFRIEAVYNIFQRHLKRLKPYELMVMKSIQLNRHMDLPNYRRLHLL